MSELKSLKWLGLEVKYLKRAKNFYRKHLDLPLIEKKENQAVFEAGDSKFILRQPSTVPRGGVHTHFAFSTPRQEYSKWYDDLSEKFNLVQKSFGDYTSLYFYDHDNHCVEIGQSDKKGEGIVGIFEIVLEVEDLERAENFYSDLGMEPYDYGDDRRRIRLDAGVADFELWEPQLGIADAQGGVHVDVGFGTDDKEDVIEKVNSRTTSIENIDDNTTRIRDPDGHYLTFSESY